MLNLEAIARAPINTRPLSYFMAPGVLSAVDLAAIRADFPQIDNTGAHSLSELIFGPAFGKLVAELKETLFRSVIEEKWGVDLTHWDFEILVCGRQHDTAETQIRQPDSDLVSCVLFLNQICDDRGGGIRPAQTGSDAGKDIPETPVSGGTFASFLTAARAEPRNECDNDELRCLLLTWQRKEGANNDAP